MFCSGNTTIPFYSMLYHSNGKMANQAEKDDQTIFVRIDTKQADRDEHLNDPLKTPPKHEHLLNKIDTNTLSQHRSMVRQISMDQCPISSNFEEINPFVDQKNTKGGVGCLRYDDDDYQNDNVPKDVVEDEDQNDLISQHYDEENQDHSPNSANEDILSSPQTSFRVPPGTPFEEKNNKMAFISGPNGVQIGIGHRRNDLFDETVGEESQFENSTSAFLTNSDTSGLPFPTNFSLDIQNKPQTPRDRQHVLQPQNECDTSESNIENEQNDSLSSLFPLQKPINRPRQPSFPMRLTASLLLASKGQEDIAAENV